MKYSFLIKQLTYLWFHKCTKFLNRKFLKFTMVTEAWNPASCKSQELDPAPEPKKTKLPDIKLLS